MGINTTSKLKRVNRLKKSKTLSVALALGLIISNLVSVVPAVAANTPSSALVSVSSGNMINAYFGATTVTAISEISGTAQVGAVLTAGELTPEGATVSHQWQRSASLEGIYTNIAGATTNTYTLTTVDINKFIKVVAAGTGNYSGKVTSAATPVVLAPTFITKIDAITGTARVGAVLTAGALTPEGATVSYQWQRSATLTGKYTNIETNVSRT